MIEPYYLREINQYQIAKLFNVSQPSVHHRLRKAAQRIRYWVARPDLTASDVRAALTPLLPPEDTEIMVLTAETTSQARTGRAIGQSQSYVRYRFLRSIKRIEREEGHWS